MIQRGMDPVQARKESLETMKTFVRIDKKDFEKRVRKEAEGIEERLLREGVGPEEARRRARKEAEERLYHADAPVNKNRRPIRYSRPPRPRANPDPMALFMGCAIACMLLPFVALVFFVLLATAFGG